MKNILILPLALLATNVLAQESNTSQRLTFAGNYTTNGNANYRAWNYGNSINDHETSITFEIGYAKRLTDMIDLSLSPFINYSKYGGEYKTYLFGFAIGPVFNFGTNYTDSIFLALP